jgi:hypothetical protein
MTATRGLLWSLGMPPSIDGGGENFSPRNDGKRGIHIFPVWGEGIIPKKINMS